MKNKLIFGLMLIISLSFAFIGCGDSDSGDSSSNDTKTKFEGTWNKQEGNSIQIIFTGNSYLFKLNGVSLQKGTFTFTATELTLDSTHSNYGDWVPNPDSWTCTCNFTNDDIFVLSGTGTNSAYGTYTRQ